ncbi:MAG: hypothetical protein GY815_13235 [Gammaproteobacteria bacterium]|nr:hypothetical protein [Gammaproteobacteria bacterium]
MNDDTIPFDETEPFEQQLSDEAAYALSDALHWLAVACDEKYLAQIMRHMKTVDETRPVDPEQPWLQNLLPR